MNGYFNKFFGFLLPTTLIPISEIYAWSNNEKVHILFHTVNELIKNNNLFTEGFTKLKDLFDDLDETLQKEVADYIEEMYENGELKDIIKDVASDYLNSGNFVKTSQLEMRRIWRECYRVGTNDRIRRPGLRPNSLQSGTKFTYENVDYIAVGLAGGADYSNTGESGTQTYVNDNAGVLQIWRMEDYTVAGQICFTTGHFDCMDFNPTDGYFYIAPKNYGSGNTTTDIIRIHITNILGHNVSVTDFCYLPFIPDSSPIIEKMQADITNPEPFTYGVGVGSISGATGENNKVYIGQYSKVFLFEWGNSTPIEQIVDDSVVYEIEKIRNSNLINGRPPYANISVTENYIFYALTAPNIIIRVNRNEQKIDWIYNIPRMLNGGMFTSGENEGLKVFDNGDCYLFTYTLMQQGGGLTPLNTPQLRMAQCFYQNLNTNIGIRNDATPYHNLTAFCYVDNTIVTHNPIGTETNPFNNILEAVYWVQSQTQYNNIRIRIKNKSNPYFIYVCTRCNVTFEAYAFDENNNRLQVTIGGAYVRGSSGMVSFYNCIFWYSMQKVLTSDGVPTNENAYLSVYHSQVTLRGCSYESNASGSGVKTANYIRGSYVSMQGNSDYLLPSSDIVAYKNQSEWETGSDFVFINNYNSCVLSFGKNVADINNGIMN